MQRLLGVPVGTLAVVLAVTLLLALGFVGYLAVRNRILLSMGLRNVTRRRGRSALIVVGLMLATAIISSALVTGDTIAHSIRSTVLVALGNTDEMVTLHGAKSAGTMGGATEVGYFDQATAARVAANAGTLSHVDAATPAIIEDVSVQDRTTRQNEPRVTLFAASDMRGLGNITAGGRVVGLNDLRPGELYLNEHAAKELDARAGNQLVVLAGGRLRPMTVREVVSFRGSGTDASALLVPMSTAQDLLGKPFRVNHIIISNSGGAIGGVRYTDTVIDELKPTLAAHGLEAKPVKQDAIDVADKAGNAFMTLFTTFGMFSISAGLLLIFLIFVMLAAERRGEMGIARAVGMQRRHLIQAFLFEGTAYDLLAAVVGVALGIGVAFGMVTVMASALGEDQAMQRAAQPRSLVVAGCVGLLVTLVVVAASARRVSRLNIVTAIRNLADPPRPPRRRTALFAGLGVAVGALFTLSGTSSTSASVFMLGVSLILISLATLARTAGMPPRPAYTAAGLALVAWWLLPTNVLKLMVPNLSMDFSIWIIGGLMVVLGASWVIVYNADVLLSAVMAVFGRIRSAAPVLKTSIAYPLRSRFRTGITLAMFTLVVYTLVVGSATTNAFTGAFNNVSAFGGGFDVVASSAPFSPVQNMGAALKNAPGLRADDFRVVSSQSYLPIQAAQAGTGRKAEDYLVRGLDDAFLTHTTYGFATMATGYHSARQVWRAVQRDPTLAVVDSTVVPRHNNWNFGSMSALKLTGFYIEDKSFTPVKVVIRDPQTGNTRTYKVIGVLKDTAPTQLMAGVAISQRAMSDFAARVRPSVYYLALRPGVDPEATAKKVESAFLANGMQADAMRKLLADTVSTNKTMNRIVLGFMGLGLIVGIAALGVISARSVVERRQQIGVLRAIGYQRRMVQASFLLESSFIALVAIVLGTGLGLLTAWNVISDAATQPTWGDISFAVPWVELVVVFVAVYAAALLTTYGPSRRAARTYPAEALRYQ